MRRSPHHCFLFCLAFLLSNQPSWTEAASRSKLGDKAGAQTAPQATPAESLTVLPGFKVDLVRSAQPGEGSWICMTTDSKGRLIISPQADDQPLLRITLDHSGHVKTIEPIPVPLHTAMGLLYAHHSLYVNGHGPQGNGLYRLVDANHNDVFETNEVHFLKRFEGSGEHGYHALALGPDKMVYVMNGNHTKVPKGIEPNSPHKNYQEDFLLPRQWDANGHAVGILAPGGYVVRTDPEGKKWELMLAGFRNTYDFDFSPDGEMFTFDADMEWDWGLPWYRPTRIIHCVTGGEYGWRSGSGKWPEYYADSLPAVVDIGLGSPTGVKFGTRSNFPKKYRQALFAFDWTYGRIFAVHLKPQGASYAADYEVFLQGKPLNLTSLGFGNDGAMYFITGGRGTQSGLYRVSYVGQASQVPSIQPDPTSNRTASRARALRLQLEAFQGKEDPKAVGFAWLYLGSEDRFIRYAARIALEWQPVASWKDRALAETNAETGLNALLALARCSGRETQPELLLALKKFPFDSLSVTQKLEKLRVIELSFIRQGKPEPELEKLAVEKLDRMYPADNELLNRELSQLLIYLEAPDVATKTLNLLDKAGTQEEQAQYIFQLRNLKTGWTLQQRKHYFAWFDAAGSRVRPEVSYEGGSAHHASERETKPGTGHPAELLRWFKEADRKYSDGASYAKYLKNIRSDAIATLSENERTALGSLVAEGPDWVPCIPTKERHFVKDWKLADLEPALDRVSHGRSFVSGKAAFNDAECRMCHRYGNEGGSVGPELTAASRKYSRRDILESILEPSKVVSEQYQNYTVIQRNGEGATGRIIDETDNKVVIQPNPLSSERIEFNKADIAERQPSKISPMPEGLADLLTEDEILDLLAYIESGGNEQAPNFKAVAGK
jgi:putative heme-binding domain-containing protein